MEPPSYLYLLVALNISVYLGDIKSMDTWMLRVLSSYPHLAFGAVRFLWVAGPPANQSA